MKLIAFCGPQRHGKTTAAEYLKSRYSFNRLTFAAPVKEIADMLFGEMQHLPRNEPVPFFPHQTPVEIWQKLGTEAIRSLWPDAWVNKAERTTVEWKLEHAAWKKPGTGPLRVVNDDLRFPNEVAWVKGKGGVIVRVRDPRKDVAVLGVAGHESERYRDEIPADVELVNDGSLEDYYQKIDELVQKVC